MSTPLTAVKEALIKVSDQNFILSLVKEIVQENTHVIEELNRDQLNSGINADSTEIEPEYTELTQRIKASKGQPFDRVTLKDKGNVHKSIKAKVFQKSFEMIAGDPKVPELIVKYGEMWLGLSEDSQQIFIDQTLLPELSAKLRLKFKLV